MLHSPADLHLASFVPFRIFEAGPGEAHKQWLDESGSAVVRYTTFFGVRPGCLLLYLDPTLNAAGDDC